MNKMKKLSFLVLLVVACVGGLKAQFSLSDFFADADAFFKEYAINGNVAYAAIKKSPSQLESLYKQVGEMHLTGKADPEIKAFYINSYNILVIYQVVERYPLKGPLTVNGFFDKIEHQVAGNSLTLDGLEKGTLLKRYPDARIHFAVVCAALGCPQIANFAFVPDKLENQLNKRASEALDRDYFIRLDHSKKKVGISKIFEWYQGDFKREERDLLVYINQFRSDKIPDSYKTQYYEYDWSLNEHK